MSGRGRGGELQWHSTVGHFARALAKLPHAPRFMFLQEVEAMAEATAEAGEVRARRDPGA